MLAEDYVPCETHHEPYTDPGDAPDLASGTGLEVLYQYDTLPTAPWKAPPGNWTHTGFLAGRLVATFDRGSVSYTGYDARGRVVQVATRLARPNTTGPLSSRHAPRWYQRSFVYDGADREIAADTGARVAELTAQDGTSAVTTTYSRRGSVKSVAGSYGPLVADIDRAADGLLEQIVYGDLASTTTANSYDNRRRLRNVITYRGPPSAWTAEQPPQGYQPPPQYSPDSSSPSTFQILLQDDEYAYDPVNNPVQIQDWRIAEEWPASAKPVTRRVEYDDLYRVSRVDYDYAAGDDDWTSPFAAELDTNPENDDPRRAQPSPHLSYAKRVLWQAYQYDWLGNTSQTRDDANGFYDRSLGTISNDSTKPYQLQTAQGTDSNDRGGNLATQYDAAGNLTRLNLVRTEQHCLGGTCSGRLAYAWDEVGRLVRARRWDLPAAEIGSPGDPLPLTAPAADLRYSYDAGDQRVLKTARDAAGEESHTAYVFETLELRRAAWDETAGDYDLSRWTEVPYLFASGVRLARVVWHEAEQGDQLPTAGAEPVTGQHVLLELGDHLGSTSVVLDQATGELVERSTFYAYGGTESDYRPGRWRGFRAG